MKYTAAIYTLRLVEFEAENPEHATLEAKKLLRGNEKLSTWVKEPIENIDTSKVKVDVKFE